VGFAASTGLKAGGARTGEWNHWNSRTSGRLCGAAEEHKPATGCGQKTWTIPATINYGLGRATKTWMDVAFNYVSQKMWRKGKSFDVSKEFTKEYRRRRRAAGGLHDRPPDGALQEGEALSRA
jgi:hypothetical protein